MLLWTFISFGFFQSDTQTQPSDQGAKNDVKEAGQATGRAAKKTARKTKRAARKGTHAAGKQTRKGAQQVEDKTQLLPQ